MTLHDLLIGHRTQILQKCREKMALVMGPRWQSDQLEQGLPTLYDELAEVLNLSMEDSSPEARRRFVDDHVTANASRNHARESYRLGYTVSQLVHGYGSICQAITEYANEVEAPITAAEFSQLNLSLDVAIAQAVVEFEQVSLSAAATAESVRMGSLAHELRNALAAATMAYELIQRGGVGATGATGTVLANAHKRMLQLLDRAMVELRMDHEPMIHIEKVQIVSLISEVESSSIGDAFERQVSISIEADPQLVVDADRHLLTSALSNLVLNAIRYSVTGGQVWINAYLNGKIVHIDVRDQCGGLPPGKVELMFEPFARSQVHQPGLGLGLSIAKRAVELNNGSLSVQDMPGVGCIFTIQLPVGEGETPGDPLIVAGGDSRPR